MDHFPELTNQPQVIMPSQLMTVSDSTSSDSTTATSVPVQTAITNASVTTATSVPVQTAATNASVTTAVTYAAVTSAAVSVSQIASTKVLTMVETPTEVIKKDNSVPEPKVTSVTSVNVTNESSKSITNFKPVSAIPITKQSESVSTVPLRNEPIMSTIQPADSEGENSDGIGTVERAYNDYCAPEIEVHHAHNSQGLGSLTASSVMDVDWEKTLVAAESEDDHLITPAQRNLENISISDNQEPPDEEMLTIQVNSNDDDQNEDRKRKEMIGSSDDDNSANDIVMSFVSFVNSFNPLGGSNDGDEAKSKNDSKKVKMEDVNNV